MNAFLLLFFNNSKASENEAVLSKQVIHSLGLVSMPCFCRNYVIADWTPNSLFVSVIIKLLVVTIYGVY